MAHAASTRSPAQFLYSDTENPDRPDLSGAWNGESSSSHAFNAAWDHRTRTYDGGIEYTDIGDGFRADLGFLPQVGYRELVGYYGRSYYPENRKVRFFRPSIVVAAQTNRDNDRIYDLVSARRQRLRREEHAVLGARAQREHPRRRRSC